MADVADLGSEPLDVELLEISAVDRDDSLIRVIESHHKLNDGGFTTSRVPDKSIDRVRLDFQVECIQYFARPIFRVGKCNILKFDLTN